MPEPFDFEAALSGCQGKLLFIGSDADTVCPLDDIAELSGRIAGTEAFGIDGLDHRELCLDRSILSKMLEFLGYT